MCKNERLPLFRMGVHNGQFLSWVLISQSFQNVNGIATDQLWYPLLFKWF